MLKLDTHKQFSEENVACVWDKIILRNKKNVLIEKPILRLYDLKTPCYLFVVASKLWSGICFEIS